MKKVAEWLDPRSKVTYRLASDAQGFILERRQHDAIGDPCWQEVTKFSRLGSGAGDLTTLAIGLEQASASSEVVKRGPFPIKGTEESAGFTVELYTDVNGESAFSDIDLPTVGDVLTKRAKGFSVGDRVRHNVYGDGSVYGISDLGKCHVDFDSGVRIGHVDSSLEKI